MASLDLFASRLAVGVAVAMFAAGCGDRPKCRPSTKCVGPGPAAPGGGGAGGGGAGGGNGGAAPADAGSDVAAPEPGPFDQQALAIAAEYQAWGRVDDELRWAPWLCRIPYPGIARPSTSEDTTTHGQKLYSVFAKNHAAYPDGPHDGQVVVKESWVPEAVAAPDGGFKPTAPVDAGDHFYPYARGDGGTVFRAAERAGLFIMFKLDATTPNTDEGWVYATVTPAGQVTASGRVASCMACHETAEHDRLFGVPLSPSLP